MKEQIKIGIGIACFALFCIACLALLIFGCWYYTKSNSTVPIPLTKDQAQLICGDKAGAGQYQFEYVAPPEDRATGDVNLYCGKLFSHKVDAIDFPQVVLEGLQAWKKSLSTDDQQDLDNSVTHMFSSIYYDKFTDPVIISVSFQITPKYYKLFTDLNLYSINIGMGESLNNKRDMTPYVTTNNMMFQDFKACTDKSIYPTEMFFGHNLISVKILKDNTSMPQQIYTKKLENVLNCILDDKQDWASLEHRTSNQMSNQKSWQ